VHVTTAAIERFPHEPPVGMRGSIPERAALGARFEKRDANRKIRDMSRARMQDEDYDPEAYDDPVGPEPHPKTGLPAWGNLSTHHDIGFGTSTSVDPAATYHGSTMSAWQQHGQRKFVATPLLNTGQTHVSSQRLHAAIEDPSTRAHGRIPGRDELPRVFHDRMHGTESIVDGNHRLSADLLQGKLFSEVLWADNRSLPAMRATNQRIHKAKGNATRKVDADFVYERQMNRYYGTENW